MNNAERIAQLEAQIKALKAEQSELLKQQTKVEVDKWRGRIDDLEVQMHLGAMEADEKLGPLFEKMRHAWDEAKALLDNNKRADDS
jgi:hypothetical protein